ncbi:hypothetical protein CerSpe_273740 [Prunus speciosa]
MKLPTPIHKWNLPNLPTNTEFWLKRDDLSGMQLSGNKVRKLEFLMADTVAKGADCIIMIGASKVTTVVQLQWLPSISILTVISFYVPLRFSWTKILD